LIYRDLPNLESPRRLTLLRKVDGYRQAPSCGAPFLERPRATGLISSLVGCRNIILDAAIDDAAGHNRGRGSRVKNAVVRLSWMEVRSGNWAHIESTQAGVACAPYRFDLAISARVCLKIEAHNLPRTCSDRVTSPSCSSLNCWCCCVCHLPPANLASGFKGDFVGGLASTTISMCALCCAVHLRGRASRGGGL
jgi:hypothetical protein